MKLLGKNITTASVKNFFFPTPDNVLAQRSDNKQNLNKYPARVQLQRLRQDIGNWRNGASEAEHAYFPHRVTQQQIYIDTALNGHVKSCMERRRNLTLLRDFKICNDAGDTDDVWTKFFQKQWFYRYMQYVVDSNFYGYNLIALGDLIKDEFSEITVIKRHDVSPDRLNVTPFIRSISGVRFMDKPYSDWHIWVPTPEENGISNCGYGLLYNVAFYEILIRNNFGHYANYNQLFAMPIRWIKTPKTNEDEVAELQAYLENMASQSYLITDTTEELELIETKAGGKGADTFDKFNKLCEAIITKIILGHSDALDSIPGKLGAGQGEDSPVTQALEDIQVKDGRMVEAITNGDLFSKLRNIGIDVPMNLHFAFNNDAEIGEQREKEDQTNKVTAEIAQTMKNAGLQMDEAYFSKRTGIPCKKIEEPKPLPPGKPTFKKEIQNKLSKIYKA